jgi:predicted ATPase/class 3 adenylate cyclase/DNA-binding CsgD family transcriptional regulator
VLSAAAGDRLGDCVVSGLPGGAVTFLFTDIEGSTRLVKVLRGRYPQVLAEHRRLVRAAVAGQAGCEVDTQGDGFFAVFAGAKQAVLCALEIQRALAAHEWPDGAPVRVRIGIHTGHAVRAGGAYTGLTVHRAARICAAAGGGQVLVSQATQTIIEDEEEEPGFTLVDLGERTLKDLDRPVRLFQLAAAGLEAPSLLAGGRHTARRAGGPGAVGGAAVVHGLPAALTSFVGRGGPVREVAGLLEEHRLVTVTGPGGSGKTRLAGEVARRVAARFADGAWVVELAPVADPGQVAEVVAAGLGVREQPGLPIAGTLARVLARQQLLLVLDNCEHVIAAAAGLCAELVAACDDLRVLATSREPLQVGGEARYRLGPLAVPDPGDLADAARAEAVVLFADRARQADAHFVLDGRSGPAVARLVARLDGMPLAIELAAARAEALGVSGLLARLEDRFALLAGGDRLAPPRQRSLAATVEWSYQLLDEPGRRAFRAVSVFPGPFTLEGAEAVAGADAGLAVLRLVDCSLLVPPRAGADGRPRYMMLETLRAYGTRLRDQAGEQDTVAVALAGYVLRVAEEASAGMETAAGEAAAARRLDAEDPAMRQVLAWAVDHDPAVALRLAVALGWWWWLGARLAGQYRLLCEVAGRAEPGSDGWCAAQLWLGVAADMSADQPGALGHFTAARDALQGRDPSRLLVDVLSGRATALLNTGQLAEGTEEGRRALAVARGLGDPAAEGPALVTLGIAASYRGDHDGAIELIRRLQQTPAGVPAHSRCGSTILVGALIDAGDLAAAESACAAALARCREAGDMTILAGLLSLMADLHVQAGRFQDAAARLREGLQVVMRTGDFFEMTNCLWACGWLCTATGRYADAATVWAARDVHTRQQGFIGGSPEEAGREQEALAKIRHALGPARVRAAEERGAAMSLDTAAEYALMLTAPAPAQAAAGPGLGGLSARERELVTLVAQGRTDAQIAAQLYISIRTVRSHLDRIRDKTGCRRRADLTRLALQADLV